MKLADRTALVVAWLLALGLVMPIATAGDLEPPVAKIVPKQLTEHGHTRTDDYYWLRERENPEVVKYLEAENIYTDAVMAHTKPLQEKLFAEITGRIEPNDQGALVKDGEYYYYTRYEEGQEYPIYCRRKGSPEAPEEVLVDGNQLANGHEFFSIRGDRVSPEHDVLAFATDTVGRRFYTLRFKDLATGKVLEDVIPDVTAVGQWANDNRTFFYVKQHPETLRWYRIYRHVLGSDPKDDVLVYEEPDETFSAYISKSRSKKFLLISVEHTLATEYRLLDASTPEGTFEVFEPRDMGHEYHPDHSGDSFFVRTNLDAENFRLMETPVGSTAKEHWKEVVPHRQDVLLSDLDAFADHLVLTERRNGLIQIRIWPLSGKPGHYLDFGEPAYDAWLDKNREFETHVLRYVYTSLTTPKSVYEYDVGTRDAALKKRDEVVGGYDPAGYVTERLYARARDGIAVPISIVYRKGTPRDGSSPLLLYAYGSYGSSTDASFKSSRLSLLDRGFSFAIAHIRGGQELGRQWYEHGKLLEKKNTFTDFIDCGLHLVEQRYTSPDRLFAEGGSAGGLLMGAITNMRPDLFRGVLSGVPFVDVVTTMLDESIPLTASEWDEWGDPRKQDYYEYMLSYSPYDNIEKKDYPNLLVTTSLHDSQVQYWEPAKYVARLRATKTDQNRLLLKTDMQAGHGGKSGRFKRHRDTAFEYAFLLDLAGISK